MIKAIVFDVGGVILRTENQTGRQELEEAYHLPPGSVHSLVFNSPVAQSAALGEADASDVWEYVSDKLSLSPQELLAFKNKFWSGDKVDQKIVAFLQSLQAKYQTALLSNAWNDLRGFLANPCNIIEGQTVDHILISAELGVAKPNPKIYKILVEKLNCKYEEILFIDDFIENIMGAKSLGIETIHYRPGFDLINEIKSRLE